MILTGLIETGLYQLDLPYILNGLATPSVSKTDIEKMINNYDGYRNKGVRFSSAQTKLYGKGASIRELVHLLPQILKKIIPVVPSEIPDAVSLPLLSASSSSGRITTTTVEPIYDDQSDSEDHDYEPDSSSMQVDEESYDEDEEDEDDDIEYDLSCDDDVNQESDQSDHDEAEDTRTDPTESINKDSQRYPPLTTGKSCG